MSEQRPWLKMYPSGVPANINPDEYTSVVEYLEIIFERHRNKPAFICMDKVLTFDEVDKKSAQFGAYLLSRGLEAGDKIAIMMPNLLQYPIALFGALRAGLIVVNTNPLYTPREMEHQFVDADVKAIIIAENFAANLQKILDKTQIKTVITTSIGEMLSPIKRFLVNFVVRRIKKMVPAYNIPNTVNFREALAQGKKFSLPQRERNADDTIIIQYTGGTTGVSKGAMLTNRNLLSNALQMKAVFDPFMSRTEQDMALCPLPMYHIFAFTVNALGLFSFGCVNVLVTNARDLDSVIGEMKKRPMSIVIGVNTLFNALLNKDNFKEADFSKLKITIGGGAAVQKPVAEKWQQITGCILNEGYGMTEASPVVAVNPLDGTGRIGTIGLPLPSTDVRVVNDQYEPVALGEEGEIQVQGPQVMKGYYKRPKETEETIRDGWLCTGDIGVMLEDGYFKIVDRKKDMILVSGFNVFPNEIEEVIAEHPKVVEAAVIGVPHEKSGEVVKAFIVKKDGSLTEKEIVEFCRENMTGYKVPKEVAFLDELPKTNVGKILRRKLRD